MCPKINVIVKYVILNVKHLKISPLSVLFVRKILTEINLHLLFVNVSKVMFKSLKKLNARNAP
jgi:hypothetical protein